MFACGKYANYKVVTRHDTRLLGNRSAMRIHCATSAVTKQLRFALSPSLLPSVMTVHCVRAVRVAL